MSMDHFSTNLKKGENNSLIPKSVILKKSSKEGSLGKDTKMVENGYFTVLTATGRSFFLKDFSIFRNTK